MESSSMTITFFVQNFSNIKFIQTVIDNNFFKEIDINIYNNSYFLYKLYR